MGNRGTVIFHNGKKEISCAVYLHWNGGADSIYNFIEEGKKRKSLSHSVDYAAARFIQIVGEFMDETEQGSTSLGVVNGPKAITIKQLSKVQTDSSDNGLYVFNIADWSCRRFTETYTEKNGEYTSTFNEMSKEEVAKEYEEAIKSNYTKNFKEFFNDLRYKKYKISEEKIVEAKKDMAITDYITV
jgi:hypothetical protein